METKEIATSQQTFKIKPEGKGAALPLN